MAVKKGFEVHLFADETQFPQLANPVQMQFDTKGRLWVAAWADYPKWEPLKESKDALLILHDDNNDGKGDRMTEFAKVNNPLGFEFWNGGVLVTRQSELFSSRTPMATTKPTCAPSCCKASTAATRTTARTISSMARTAASTGRAASSCSTITSIRGDRRCRPHRARCIALIRAASRSRSMPMNSPNPHGTSFDYWGYQYATDGTGGRAYQVRPEGSGFKMYELLKKEVRPVTASEVVSSTHFPEDMQGDFLICNVIGFLGVKHYDLARDADKGTVWGEPAGDELTVKVTQADGTVTEEKSTRLPHERRQELPSLRCRLRARWLALHRRLAQRHHRPHAAQRARPEPRPQTRPHLSHHRHGPRVAEDRRHRRPADPRAARKPEAPHRQHAPSHPHRTQRARFQGSHRRHAGMDEAVRSTKKEDAHPLLEALWLIQQHNVRNTRVAREAACSRPSSTPATPRTPSSISGSTSRPACTAASSPEEAEGKSEEVRHPQRHTRTHHHPHRHRARAHDV
jgi:hypothetical protein